MKYLYLHGLASGTTSSKAQFLCNKFKESAQTLSLLDFNQDDFCHLTLSRQIVQVEQAIANEEAVTLIGSSLGGLTAAWVAQRKPSVVRLVLLAPAFGFLDSWLDELGDERVQDWKNDGFMSMYHYGFRREERLHYGFVNDLRQYSDAELTRHLPTLILHGKHDNTIPIESVRRYRKERRWVKLVELSDDHGLGGSFDGIFDHICLFCEPLPL